MQIIPILMSGGSGTRLWPVSHDAVPKQFHALGGALTMIQETASRVAGGGKIDFAAPIVVCNKRHAGLVQQQLGAPLPTPSHIVLEPVGRNTAAVAAVAAALAMETAPGALVLLMPADHVVTDPDAFEAAIVRAASVADRKIVTFGINPSEPATGYGYIRAGAALGEGVFEAADFVEKPDLETAERYLESGEFSWNSGIFLYSPELMLREMERLQPQIRSQAALALEAAERDGVLITLDETSLRACPSESLDYAVMEHTRDAAVVPCDVGWADIGSWSELWRLHAEHAGANVVSPQAVAVDSSGSLVWSEGVPLAVLGVKNLVVVASAEGVLVLPKSRAQEVKGLLQALKDRAGQG